MKLKRAITFGLASVGIAMLAVAGVAAWLTSTQSGARFVVARAVSGSTGVLSVGEVSGRLSQSIALSDVRVATDGSEVEIDSIELGLALSEILRGAIVIEDLRSSVIRYRSLGTAPNDLAATESGFSLPVSVALRRASIEGVVIEAAEEPVSLERLIVSAEFDGTRAEVLRLEGRWQELFVSTQGRASWGDAVRLDGLVSWSGSIAERTIAGSAAVDGVWPALDIDVDLLDPVAATARGSILVAAAPAFDLVLGVQDIGELAIAGGLDPAAALWRAEVSSDGLDPARLGLDRLGQIGVDGNVTASLGEPLQIELSDFELTATLAGERLDVQLSGRGDNRGTVEVDRLAAALGRNRLQLSGRVASEVAVDIAAELDDLAGLARAVAEIQPQSRFATLIAPVSGAAVAEFSMIGDRAAPIVDGSISVADSSFADLPLSVVLDFSTGTGSGEAERIEIEQLEAHLGSTRIGVSGSILTPALGVEQLMAGDFRTAVDSTVLDLSMQTFVDDVGELAQAVTRIEVDALANLEAVLADAAGQANARFAIGGPVTRADIDGRIEVADAELLSRSVTRAALDLRAGLYSGGVLSIDLEAESDSVGIALAAAGSFAGGSFVGAVDSLNIDEPVLGDWRLNGPVDVTAGSRRVEFDDACLVNASGEVCASWRYGNASDRLAIRASEFELAALGSFLPPTLSLTGRIGLTAELDSPTSSPSGFFELAGTEIDVVVALSDSDNATTRVNDLVVRATLDEYALEANASFVTPTGSRADIAMNTADVRQSDAPIGGRFEIAWSDVGVLSLLSPEIGEVAGTLDVAIDIAGTANMPELAGSASIRNGRVAVPEVGIEISGISAEAQSFDGGLLEFAGVGYIDEGELRVTGSTELDADARWPTRLRLVGENLPLARRADATVFASPDFSAEILLPSIAVTGSILIPEADISVEQLPEQAVRVSPDSVVHGDAIEDTTRPLDVTADVTVELGDRVSYTGSGLDTDLAGSLRLDYASGQAPVASGNLSLAGTYDAYGQTLVLERGELLFAGPLDNPAMDVLAVREIGSTTVGIRLSGTIQSPTPSIYSDPPMSETDALAYLISGRPFSSTDDAEAATLESTAVALGLRQALPVVQRVGESLGLDELSIEPNDVDAGALMAGKYLSPRVYMSYSYGLFNRLGGFLLRYDINDRFSLETRSGNEKSMDLLYSIEKE